MKFYFQEKAILLTTSLKVTQNCIFMVLNKWGTFMELDKLYRFSIWACVVRTALQYWYVC